MNALALSKDDVWKQYEINVDLYKHYLKLTIEINVFYYAITGAIVSYYFAHRMEAPDIRFALMLPILMSVLLALFFIYGSIMNRYSRDEMFRVRDALGLRVSP
jgi:cytochrome b subunit of formate dehydrogenase